MKHLDDKIFPFLFLAGHYVIACWKNSFPRHYKFWFQLEAFEDQKAKTIKPVCSDIRGICSWIWGIFIFVQLDHNSKQVWSITNDLSLSKSFLFCDLSNKVHKSETSRRNLITRGSQTFWLRIWSIKSTFFIHAFHVLPILYFVIP